MRTIKRGRSLPHSAWITRSPSGIETGYQKLTRSLQYSDAVWTLSNLAYRVYIDMLMTSKGQQEVIYSQSIAMKHMKISKGGYTEATKQLIEVGLIKRMPRGCYAASRFKFSEAWKKYELPRDMMTNEIISQTIK